MSFTSTFPLLAHRKHSSLGVTGTEVSRLRPPASHAFSTSWSLLKSTLMRCTPSQGTLDMVWPLVEGVLRQFKVLLLGDFVVSGCSGDKSGESALAGSQEKVGADGVPLGPLLLTLSFGLGFGDGGTEWISGFLTGLGSTVGEIRHGSQVCTNLTADAHHETKHVLRKGVVPQFIPAIRLYGYIP